MKSLIVSICLAIGLAQAATLPYQGLATDAKGNPQADASYQVDFALYPSANGVTPLWSESQKLSTRKGLFSTQLGNETPIPDSLFKGTPLYLGVSFGGGSEGGRVLLGTTPWATAAGKSTTAATATYADSAGKVAGMADSLKAMHLAIKDTAASLRTKAKADSQALAKNVTDSTKALRDTVTNLRSTIASQATAIAGLNTTVSSQAATIASLQSFVWNSYGGIPWNTSIQYGTVTDDRDGQSYRTVVIGSQTWMAQNLNYAGTTNDTGKCYNNSASYCAKYGRLYTWSDVMKGAASSSASPSGVKGLCPTGWHVPSDAEWTTMQNVVDATNTTGGTKLKSTVGWYSPGNGTDNYGFRALPGGFFYGTSFSNVGSYGSWWSATWDDAYYDWYRYMNYSNAYVGRISDYFYPHWYSLRCMED